ncbi:MAG: c-di-GMP-binding flagellar brake protein YcgR [Lentisphaeria bacterium]|jgi:c-di-GMP-binding flagellar brake protein YcgR
MNSVNRDYSEKRNYIRMKVDAPVSIQIPSNNEVIEGTCRDLSGGGLLVEIKTALPVGTTAEVVICSGHGHSPMLKARAEVMRIISQPENNEKPCLLGMEIIEVLN